MVLGCILEIKKINKRKQDKFIKVFRISWYTVVAFFLRYYKKKQEKRSQYQIETINENGSIGNSYYAFYIEILEYVNDYCLKRIDTVGFAYGNGPTK